MEESGGAGGVLGKRKELLAAMLAFQKEIGDPFLKRENLDRYQNEQLANRDLKYRKKNGFQWEHLKMFEKK